MSLCSNSTMSPLEVQECDCEHGTPSQGPQQGQSLEPD